MLQRHEAIHIGGEFICECGSTYQNATSLTKHRIEIHGAKRPKYSTRKKEAKSKPKIKKVKTINKKKKVKVERIESEKKWKSVENSTDFGQNYSSDAAEHGQIDFFNSPTMSELESPWYFNVDDDFFEF
jgi:hypothetical protein